MSATLRAAVSLLTLLGFYVFALALIVGMVVGGVMITDASSTAGIKVIVIALVAAVGVLIALWKVATFKPQPAPGIDVSPAQAPELWALVGELAATVGTRAPEQIRLVPEVNAAVSEDSRFLGLAGGTRRLYLGVPLLQGMTVAQLQAVLAHELGHYSSAHTRLGPLAYRGRQAVVTTVQQLKGNIVGWVLRQYAKLYILVSQAMSRSQELEADRLMVQVAGRATAQSALREIPVLGAAWGFYMKQYVSLGWESGLAPTSEGFFGGFSWILRGRAAELAEIRADAPPAERSVWDSHPPIATRIAAMDALPNSAWRVEEDTRPAVTLLPGFPSAATAVAEETVAFADRERLPWEQLVHRALTLDEQHTADAVYRTAARLAGLPSASLGTVLDLAYQGRAAELVREAMPHAGDEAVPAVLALVARSAATQTGAAYWRLSWDSAADLVTRAGEPFDADRIAALAVDPATTHEAAAALTALGVDIGRAGQVSAAATAHGGDIVGGIADVKVDGSPRDMLILDNGLILAERSDKRTEGKDRLVALARSGPVTELAATHRFIAYESVASVQPGNLALANATLTLHDGTSITFKEPLSAARLTKQSAEAFHAFLAPYTGQPVG